MKVAASKRRLRELKLRARWLKDRVGLPPSGSILQQAISKGFANRVVATVREVNTSKTSLIIVVGNIEKSFNFNINQQAIAALIGVNQSSVSRELSRNTGLRGYRHNQAHRASVERRQETMKPHKMTPQLIDEWGRR